MSHSGYDYGVSQGYHPASNYPEISRSSLAQQYFHEPPQAAIQPSYQYPRNVIPGLGLGFASDAPDQQSAWAGHQSGNWESSSKPPKAAGQSYNNGSPHAPDSKPSTMIHAGLSSAEDGTEEGEISEGEEDLYDPREAENLAAVNGPPASPQQFAGQGNDVAMLDRLDAPKAIGIISSQATHFGKTRPAIESGQEVNTARERSGSYSPHLSPQEINAVIQQASTQGDPRETTSKPAAETASSNHAVASPPLSSMVSDMTLLPVDVIAIAKKKAQDAILGLWPHNIRHQDFLNEGVDDAILKGLFNDLGLDVELGAQGSQQSSANDVAKYEATAPPTSEGSHISKALSIPSRPAVTETPKALDQSEERKDRIARLLAAKGSKPAAPAAPASALPADKAKPAGPPSKAQSEKSKLLQQKMDALRKSRESLNRFRSQQTPANAEEAQAGTAKPLTTDVTAAELNVSEESASFLESLASEPGSNKPSPSIPGLFLSTTQLSHQADSVGQGRPTPTSRDASAKPIRRPFGQRAESRPFLINVSDDDAEMDIDSPGRTSPANNPDTPIQKAAGVMRDSLTIKYAKPGHAVTPLSAATPPRSSSHASGGEDLAKMNKKIEVMKRKIAEAEARKKTKLLRQDSPAVSQLNDSSCSGSMEPASTPRDSAATLLTGQGETPVSNDAIEAAAVTMSQERPSRSRKNDQDYGSGKCKLSTTASERLPFIEARRKEQLLRVQRLQSEIAMIEQEIAKGMRDEQSLKQDVVSSDTDSEASQKASQTAPGNASGSEESLASHGNAPAKAPGLDGVEQAQALIDSEGGEIAERTEALSAASADQANATLDGANLSDPQHEHEVAMVESEAYNDMRSEKGSDDYEPPGADSFASPQAPSPREHRDHSPQPCGEDAIIVSASAATAQDSAAGQAHTVTETGPREEDARSTEPRLSHGPLTRAAISEPPQARYAPYETPLQYFRAFRFHPEFSKSVAGGLRSLTYSNKIDVHKEVCPDELAGQACPRGDQCEYQHFESMRAPDEQILLQLGATGNYQAEQKQQYIAGLRQLLTDFRNRKVKDFDTISRGIIEYRTQFLRDRSKILPLGGVVI